MSRLRITQAPGERAPDGRADLHGGDSVSAWLDVVVTLSGLPGDESRDVRDELEDHLRTRSRELMLGGMSENDAARTAIAEIGDAATLAKGLRGAKARKPRRTVMAWTTIGVVGVAAATAGILAVKAPGDPMVRTSVYAPATSPDAEKVRAVKIAATPDMTFGEFFQGLGKAAGMPVVVHWPQLHALAHSSDGPEIAAVEPLGVEFAPLSLIPALDLLNDSLNLTPDNRVEWRLVEGTILFASTAYFDRLETSLVTYDLGSLPATLASGEHRDSVGEMIPRVVEPTLWADHGGDRATLTVFAGRLFVKAPRRVHDQIEWVLSEIRKGSDAAPTASADPLPARSGTVKAESQSTIISRMVPLDHFGPTEAAELVTRFARLAPDIRRSEQPLYAVEVGPSSGVINLIGRPEHVERAARLLRAVESWVKTTNPRLDRESTDWAFGTTTFTYRAINTDPTQLADFVTRVIPVKLDWEQRNDVSIWKDLRVDAAAATIHLMAIPPLIEVVAEILPLIDTPAEPLPLIPC
ncbi:MAG: hypothetical protein HRU70_04280 [Phycisphaeraceae bacterium]|nr:MAG: hypothetical protein HRU70_04280 [Phycisphaeraceae bacterium]